MTEKTKLELGIIESRKAINALLAKAELSEAEEQELDGLTKKHSTLETRYAAALAVEPEKTVEGLKSPEEREMAELEARCSVGRIFQNVAEQRALDGAEAELQAELKLPANKIPIALLRGEPETRAITPAPGNVGSPQDPIIPAVFPMGAAAFLGIDMPTVGVGEPVYPVLTNNTAAADFDEAASVDETTGSFTANVLTPRRIQASFFYSREDAAKFAGMDAALRRNLSDALSSGLDKYILAKTDLGLLEFTPDPAPSGSEESFASYRAAIFGMVDGRYAMNATDVCILVGGSTFTHMSGKYRGNNADDSALDSLMMKSGGVRVSAHVPDKNATIQQAVAARGKQYRHAVAPIWEGIELIPDFVTKTKTGEIVITAVMLMNFKVLRADGFKRFGFKVGA